MCASDDIEFVIDGAVLCYKVAIFVLYTSLWIKVSAKCKCVMCQIEAYFTPVMLAGKSSEFPSDFSVPVGIW